ncbi:MAG TPA: head processing protein [Buttiauxella sp.]|jgi:hypothetical protein
MKYDSLETVTDRFSIFRNARTTRENGRNYIIVSIKNTLASEAVQEGIRLGELFGFWGHQRRELNGKLDVPEESIIMVDGKPVLTQNVPSNRTVNIEIDDDGVISHSEEILKTDPGNIVSSMIASRAGGWSWATGGPDTTRASVVRRFKGCDYVLQPNYISLDHPAMMLESVHDRHQLMLESLRSKGYSEQGAQTIIEHFEAMGDTHEQLAIVQDDVLLLEGLLSHERSQSVEIRLANEELTRLNGELDALQRNREMLMTEVLQRMPVHATEEQREAFLNPKTKADAELVTMMFESIMKTDFTQLPGKHAGQSRVYVPSHFEQSKVKPSRVVTFGNSEVPKFD